jgi:hypothetical protein
MYVVTSTCPRRVFMPSPMLSTPADLLPGGGFLFVLQGTQIVCSIGDNKDIREHRVIHTPSKRGSPWLV